MIFRFYAALALLFLGSSAPAQAQSAPEEPEVEPDRRDFTLGTGIVPRGHIQIETGATNTRSGDEREVMIGETTVRVPVSKRAEVRFSSPSYLIERQNGRAAGLDDMSITARFQLSDGEKIGTAITLDTTIPSGARRVAERRYQPRATFAARFALSKRAEVILNAGARSATSDRQRFSQFIAASSFRFEVSKRVNLFSEFYVLSREEIGGPAQKFAAAGAVYFLSNRTALDARFGLGLGNKVGGPNYLYSAGISRLF